MTGDSSGKTGLSVARKCCIFGNNSGRPRYVLYPFGSRRRLLHNSNGGNLRVVLPLRDHYTYNVLTMNQWFCILYVMYYCFTALLWRYHHQNILSCGGTWTFAPYCIHHDKHSVIGTKVGGAIFVLVITWHMSTCQETRNGAL